MSFDVVAKWYDNLASFVFGKKWKSVQEAAVSELNKCKKVLIIGGGTGTILEELFDVEVTYVEMSAKMIEIAKSRSFKIEVYFVQEDFLKWESSEQFDSVYCPFFLDLFDQQKLANVLDKIKGHLKAEGRLHVIDFQRGTIWQRLINQIMIVFFRIFAGLEVRKLPPIHLIAMEVGYRLENTTTFLNGWIFYNSYNY